MRVAAFALVALAALLPLAAALDAEIESTEGEMEGNPTYTLPYPAISYASHAVGGFFHPYSNVNPLQSPYLGVAPAYAPYPASAAAVAAAPISAYYLGAVHPASAAAALGVNTALFPGNGASNLKGGYNVHGFGSAGFLGAFHPNLAGDLTSLGGKASGAGDDAAFVEAGAGQSARMHSPLEPEQMEAGADAESGYGLFPAPAAHASPSAAASHFVRDEYSAIGPHKLQFEPVGDNVVDDAFPAFVEMDSEAESEVDAEAEQLSESEVEAQLDATIALLEADAGASPEELAAEMENVEDATLMEAEAEITADGEGEGEDKPANPTYVLPYPPVLPGHYTPLFNPYTNVNPLSTPFANYAAQPGAHPTVAAAAAARAGALASVQAQVAGAAGNYPYYPFAARHPIVAAQLAGNPVPFTGYAGWVHPQNMNSAAVGENEDAASLGQFLEVATEEAEVECVGCSYD